MFLLRDYHYRLPKELIAQTPAEERDQSRLMVIFKDSGSISHRRFWDLPDLLKAGDVLVVNDSKVLPARIWGRRGSGGKVEVLVLDVMGDSGRKRCLLKARKRLEPGERIHFDDKNSAVIEGYCGDMTALLSFQVEGSFYEFLEQKGEPPLPPYIRKPPNDMMPFHRERYQTVYSRNPGAVAAPTAGLHFSERLIKRLKEKGIQFVAVTLHVGYGTFRPVKTEDIREHKVDPEAFFVSEEAAQQIKIAMSEGRRIICVGTTSVRAVESASPRRGEVRPYYGMTDLTILPGYEFKVPSGLITNFHLPRSSLLFLVAAFMGMELLKKAYQVAIQERYRFYSYGDAMLIL